MLLEIFEYEGVLIMKKKIFVIAFSALMMLTSSVSNVFAFDDWISAYRNELTYIYNNPQLFDNGYRGDNNSAAAVLDKTNVPFIPEKDEFEYTINDIDKDGVKELIVRVATCHGPLGEILRFYTYSNGKVVFLGSTQGTSLVAGALYGCNDNGIFIYYAHSNYEKLFKVVKTGNSISFEHIYDREVRHWEGENYNMPKFPVTEIQGNDFSYLPK